METNTNYPTNTNADYWAHIVTNPDGERYIHRKYRTRQSAETALAAAHNSKDWYTSNLAEMTRIIPMWNKR